MPSEKLTLVEVLLSEAIGCIRQGSPERSAWRIADALGLLAQSGEVGDVKQLAGVGSYSGRGFRVQSQAEASEGQSKHDESAYPHVSLQSSEKTCASCMASALTPGEYARLAERLRLRRSDKPGCTCATRHGDCPAHPRVPCACGERSVKPGHRLLDSAGGEHEETGCKPVARKAGVS